jgi:SAM-dependent methyltransferase
MYIDYIFYLFKELSPISLSTLPGSSITIDSGSNAIIDLSTGLWLWTWQLYNPHRRTGWQVGENLCTGHPSACNSYGAGYCFKKPIEECRNHSFRLQTGLLDNSVDVVLLYDIFHALSDPNRVLEELHRVLKHDGILSFSDHHMKENEIISKITNRGLFKLSGKGKNTYTFLKEKW